MNIGIHPALEIGVTANLQLTLILPEFLTSFDPYTDPYFESVKLPTTLLGIIFSSLASLYIHPCFRQKS